LYSEFEFVLSNQPPLSSLSFVGLSAFGKSILINPINHNATLVAPYIVDMQAACLAW